MMIRLLFGVIIAASIHLIREHLCVFSSVLQVFNCRNLLRQVDVDAHIQHLLAHRWRAVLSERIWSFSYVHAQVV